MQLAERRGSLESPGLPPRPSSAPSCGAAGASLLRCRSQGAIRPKGRPQSAIVDAERRLAATEGGRPRTAGSRLGGDAYDTRGLKSEVAFHGYTTFAEGVYAYSQRKGAAARRNLMSFTPTPGGRPQSKHGTTREPSPFMPGGRCVTFGEAMHVYNTRGFGVARGAPLSRTASLPRLHRPMAAAGA